MALKGKFVYQHWVKTGTQEVSFMVPDDIDETDPNYENRGKEITELSVGSPDALS